VQMIAYRFLLSSPCCSHKSVTLYSCFPLL
jgi:hypothetical protein